MKDFFEVAHERMDAMSHEELKGLVFVSINHLGLEMNGHDYSTPQDAIECLALNFIIITDKKVDGFIFHFLMLHVTMKRDFLCSRTFLQHKTCDHK